MFEFHREFSFIRKRKIFYLISTVLILVGIITGMIRGFNYGIDFTGGTRFQLEMGREVTIAEVSKVMKAHHIEGEIVHSGEQNTQISIKTVQALQVAEREAFLSDMYKEFSLTEKALLDTQQFGPSVGDMLKKNAVKAVIIASLGMLVYIIIRFEWKFGLAAILSTLHDVLLLISFYGLFHIPINNPFIAAMLTILGYSINDTIVIFDRIRENLKLMQKNKLGDLIDKSINQTLVRSLMTSITTVCAIIPLYFLGGEVIRPFTLPLIIGIIGGTYSSIAIASPLYYEFCQLSGESKYKKITGKKKEN